MSRLEDRIKEALQAEAASWPEPDRTGSKGARLSRGRVTLLAAVVLVVISVAATWLVVRDVTDPTTVACYREPNLESDIVGLGPQGDLGVQQCALVWADGTLSNTAIVRPGEVPQMVGCVAESGILAVFPSTDEELCTKLGLALPSSESVTEGNDLRDLNRALVDHFLGQDCQPMDEAQAAVRGILDGRGFSHWTIEVTTGSPDRVCASFGMDVPNETVFLVPIPPNE